MTDGKYLKYLNDPKARCEELERMITMCQKTLEKEIKKDIENGEKYDVVQAKMRVLEIFSQPVNFAKNFYEKAEKIKRKEEQKKKEKEKIEKKRKHLEDLKKQDQEIKKLVPKYNKGCKHYHEIANATTKEIIERYCSIKADMFFCSTHCQFCTNKAGSDYAYQADPHINR